MIVALRPRPAISFRPRTLREGAQVARRSYEQPRRASDPPV